MQLKSYTPEKIERSDKRTEDGRTHQRADGHSHDYMLSFREHDK